MEKAIKHYWVLVEVDTQQLLTDQEPETDVEALIAEEIHTDLHGIGITPVDVQSADRTKALETALRNFVSAMEGESDCVSWETLEWANEQAKKLIGESVDEAETEDEDDEKPFIVAMQSDAYGSEFFEYESKEEADAGYDRLCKSAKEHEAKDGIKRFVTREY